MGKTGFDKLAEFRRKVHTGVPLLGTFVKTAAPHNIEILGIAGFDFVVLDAEHAPFSAVDLDRAMLAGRSVDLPVMVRVPAGELTLVSACLDLGAAGVVLPHVKGADDAEKAVAAARFAAARRGLSPSTRAGGYGSMPFHQLPEISDRAVSVWLQVEDQAGLDRRTEIAAVEGIDALFVGRVDLAYALGVKSVEDSVVQRATTAIQQAAQAAGLATVLFVNSVTEAEVFAKQGTSVFILGSDQSFLRSQASAATDAFQMLRATYL